MANKWLFGQCLLALLVAGALVAAQDEPAADDGAAAAGTRAGPGGEGNTRIFGGLLSSIFNPCGNCNAHDQAFASRCCQSGTRKCCLVIQHASNFNPGFPHPGGFHQGGSFRPPHGSFQGGFGNIHGGGFNQGFSHGFGNNNQFKPGFCPKSGGLFRSGPGGAGPGVRSAPGDDDSPAGPGAGRANRQARQAPAQNAPGADGNEQDTRFINLFGPGPVINNPFCRDECFRDRDCVGNLKCCLRDCRKCTNPEFL